jgi:glucose-6-phosphate 1-dehydrogenase
MRDEKVRLFKAIKAVTPADVVRGQFLGYRDEEGVAPDSHVETFAAVRLHIETWRWAGVPFYIRAGKRLPVTARR